MSRDSNKKPPRGDDQGLVGRYLEAVRGLTQEEAASRAPGISQDDVSRWRRGDWKRLSGPKRRALQEFLEAASDDQLEAEHDFEAALVSLLAGVRGQDPWLQLEILREISTVKRAIAAEHDSRAAERRAEAMLEDARAYAARSRSFGDEDGHSRLRRAVADAVKTGKVPADLFRGVEVPLETPAGVPEPTE